MDNNSTNTTQLTSSGFEDLKKELVERETKREKLITDVEEMRSAGDLRENDGYTVAIQLHEANEARISEIKALLENADVISNSSTGKVSIGNTVILKTDDNKTIEYKIVGATESNPLEGKISNESPIGKALINKKIGDTATVNLPKSSTTYTIIEIK